MRNRAHILCLLSVLWLLPGVIEAWAGPGHRLIARLAKDHLTPEARQHLIALIGTRDLATASLWADDLMRTPECSHTEPWHYINIEEDGDLESAERSPQGDLMRALEHFDAVLRDSAQSIQKRAWAARYLIHLVGDVHQPLHIGRRADRGGNDIAVEFFGKPTNLHLVWDFHLINRAAVSDRDLARLVKQQGADELAAWTTSSYRDWLAESLRYRRAAYETGGNILGSTYAERHLPLIELRLAQAGIRLAALFNEILSHPLESAPGDDPDHPASDEATSPCAGL